MFIKYEINGIIIAFFLDLTYGILIYNGYTKRNKILLKIFMFKG
jgi:hypothetical protein